MDSTKTSTHLLCTWGRASTLADLESKMERAPTIRDLIFQQERNHRWAQHKPQTAGSAMKETAGGWERENTGKPPQIWFRFWDNEEYRGQRWRNLDRLEVCSGSGPTHHPGLDMNHDKKAQSRMTLRYFGFLGFVDSVLHLSNWVTWWYCLFT